VTAKKDGIAFNSKVVRVAELPEKMEPRKVDLEVREAKTGSSFVIDNIHYNTSSAEIKPESDAILESFAQYLKENSGIRIEIQGHTDNVGNPADNEALSTNRAFSVKSRLEELGVEGQRINAKGFGAKKPLADNSSEEGRAKNRRTEFLIL
jgi:outer membrane protein OmpA-like peptidoglycan-associated protein